ncbi:MAG: acyl-CoA dehydrogenase family protein, partial [Bacteroidia bacterium]|nr:acyl-CoA dehydrogenase family protein [Bacteroidia bacterium]
AMTEPGTGSDLGNVKTTAIRNGDHYILNGAKTFITNGILSDLVIVDVKSNPQEKHGGISLLIVERDMEGFERGKNLDKIGLKAQDTAELFFRDVKVPVENLLGEEGLGFYYLMHNLPQERLSIAVSAIAGAEAVLDLTIQYCKERTAFGRPIGKFQNSRFKLAAMKTETTIARTFVDQCILELNEGNLSAEKASMAKYWVTDMQCKLIDECLQLHGGYGYMNDYPVAKAFRDARVSRIYGGTNEIMKEIIGRSMGF